MIRRLWYSLRMVLHKWYIAKRYHVRFGRDVACEGTVYEGYNMIGEQSVVGKCYMGRGSYVNRDSRLFHVKIGRYSSIGPGCMAGLGVHPIATFVSTHPAFYYDTRDQLPFTFYYGEKPAFAPYMETHDGFTVSIGNDVWIGARVTIVDGVCIGDGAVITAGAVVTKDVAPYSIVGGVPAREIRKRFTNEEIEQLLKRKWWDDEMEQIAQHCYAFHDVNDYLRDCLKSNVQ